MSEQQSNVAATTTTQEEEEPIFDEFTDNLFQIDESYFKKPKPVRIETYQIEGTDMEIKVSLLGDHSLWANYMWNASKCISQYFYENQDLIRDKTVIEMGAAGGLPSLVCAKLGAKKVVVTDYNDVLLIDNLKRNVELNFPADVQNIEVRGHTWGEKLEETFGKKGQQEKYDVIILSDLLFNHICHYKLLDSCEYVSHENTIIYVSYT